MTATSELAVLIDLTEAIVGYLGKPLASQDQAILDLARLVVRDLASLEALTSASKSASNNFVRLLACFDRKRLEQGFCFAFVGSKRGNQDAAQEALSRDYLARLDRFLEAELEPLEPRALAR